MDHLLRAHAPLSETAWGAIEEQAQQALRQFLAARKLVEFRGPHGWTHAAVPTGRVDGVDSPAEGVEARLRRVQPLVELRTPMSVPRSVIDLVDRGGDNPDLDVVVDAARRAAQAEDTAVFHGASGPGITGIVEASPHDAVAINEDYEQYPRSVAKAVAALHQAGIDGPYGIALGPRCYRGVIESTERGGYPVLQHLRQILNGPVVWAPSVDGAVVLSMRGGDFELICGQDLSIGYRAHDDEHVHLYLEESITFRPVEPAAAVHLAYMV